MPQMSQTSVSAPAGAKNAGMLRGRMPTKTSINFAVIGVKKRRWWLVILSLVLILAAAAVIGKFLVYDRMVEVNDAQIKASEAQQALADCNARIQSYGELNELYAHYTWSGMTSEELQRVDRVEAMELLKRVVLPRVEIPSWNLKGNQLTMNIEGKTLQDINKTVQELQDDPLVNYCEVHTAETSGDARRTVKINADSVTANVVLYLKKTEEVAGK